MRDPVDGASGIATSAVPLSAGGFSVLRALTLHALAAEEPAAADATSTSALGVRDQG